MKKVTLCTVTIFTCIILFLAACASPQKSFERGNYEQAVDLAVKRLRSEKVKEKDVATLVEAFNYINQRETDRLGRLRLDNTNGEKWAEIYDLALRIQYRQDLIQPYLALDEQKYFGLLSNCRFTEGVNTTVADAREGAAAYLYNHALANLELAKNGNRLLARDAYNDLKGINKYFNSYRDVERLTEQAHIAGINHIYVKVENDSRVALPAAFERELESIFVRDMNSKWTKYHTYADNNLNYQYTIIARMTDIDVSPEGERRDRHIEEKQIEDGFDYVMDERGNVKKDSMGNDLKTKRFSWIKADVYTLFQNKDARVFGYLEYYDNRTHEKVLSRPLETVAHFEQYSVRFDGDRRALTEETRRRLGGRLVPFPTDAAMLLTAAERLKSDTKRLIEDNDHIVSR
ncbi:MAG: hypothetical protein U5L45_10030 [Saprospiraceae bacterium]|nr:hypothetical protein [Saprospiraceae bacterium]